MNLVKISGQYLLHRPLTSLVNILLFALGIAIIILLEMGSRQMQESIQSQTKRIDLVIGAKGSPLQLILANIFHVDYPTGNIDLIQAENSVKNRLVQEAIPLASGDSHQGFRIIGTTHQYLSWYNASLDAGTPWEKPMEAVIGKTVADQLGLKTGSEFTSTHGLTQMGAHHDEHKMKVVGVLEQTGGVLDRLILTSVRTVWKLHEKEGQELEKSDDFPIGFLGVPLDSTKEITAVLVKFSSPMGVVQMPRYINEQTPFQAASPAFESTRLFGLLDQVNAFARILAISIVVVAFLSIFLSMVQALRNREYDLAIMRTLGAGRAKVLILLLLESALIAVLGSLVGILLAHTSIGIIALFYPGTLAGGLSPFKLYSFEVLVIAFSLVLGCLAALLPAIQAYRMDISKILARDPI